MKKYTLAILLGIFIFSNATAQIKLGAFAGVNMSKLSGDVEPDTKYKSKAGGNFGFLIDIPLVENIYLSFQPSYIQDGTKIFIKHPENEEHIENNKVKLNYLSLPVILKVTSDNGKFYCIGGIETSHLIHSSQTPVGEEQQVLGVEIASWNFSLDFGAGLRIPIGTTNLFFEARYSHGLNNITEDPVFNGLIPRVKTSNYRLLTGIEIPLKLTKN